METKSKKAKSQDVSKVDFDTMFNMDTKELDKQVKYQQNKKGKKVQLLAKINSLQMQFAKCKTDYTRSLIDPTMDSVELAIDMQTIAKEEEVAQLVYAQLFPKEKLTLSLEGK